MQESHRPGMFYSVLLGMSHGGTWRIITRPHPEADERSGEKKKKKKSCQMRVETSFSFMLMSALAHAHSYSPPTKGVTVLASAASVIASRLKQIRED